MICLGFFHRPQSDVRRVAMYIRYIRTMSYISLRSLLHDLYVVRAASKKHSCLIGGLCGAVRKRLSTNMMILV